MVFNIYNPDGSKAFSIESTDTNCIETNELSLESLHESAESSYDECVKYVDTIEVMSTEGFGENLKAGLKKVKERLIEFFKKIRDFFKQFWQKITTVVLKNKVSKVKNQKIKSSLESACKNVSSAMNDSVKMCDESISNLSHQDEASETDKKTAEVAKEEAKCAKFISSAINDILETCARISGEDPDDVKAKHNAEYDKLTKTLEGASESTNKCSSKLAELKARRQEISNNSERIINEMHSIAEESERLANEMHNTKTGPEVEELVKKYKPKTFEFKTFEPKSFEFKTFEPKSFDLK